MINCKKKKNEKKKELREGNGGKKTTTNLLVNNSKCCFYQDWIKSLVKTRFLSGDACCIAPGPGPGCWVHAAVVAVSIHIHLGKRQNDGPCFGLRYVMYISMVWSGSHPFRSIQTIQTTRRSNKIPKTYVSNCCLWECKNIAIRKYLLISFMFERRKRWTWWTVTVGWNQD